MTGWYRSPPCALILAILLGTIAAVLGVGGFAASAASPVMQGAPPAATATPIPEPGGYAPSLPIGGSVGSPATYALADLQSVPPQARAWRRMASRP